MNCLNRSVIVLWVAFLIQFIVAEESDEDEIVVRPHDGEQLPPNDKTADPSLIRIDLKRHRHTETDRRKRRDVNSYYDDVDNMLFPDPKIPTEIPEFYKPQNAPQIIPPRPKPIVIQNDAALAQIILENHANIDYTGVIEIGTPPKSFIINFDTGSCKLWVHSSKCKTSEKACMSHNRYDSELSSTSTLDGTPFYVKYLKGYVEGFYTADVVKMGHLNITGQIFGEALRTKTFNDAEWDGLLGLGFCCSDDIKSPMDNLKEQGSIQERHFSFKLSSDKINGDGSTLVIGGVDPTHYMGNMHLFSVVPFSSHWEIRMESVSVPMEDFSCGPFNAYIDTGSTFIMGPNEIVRKLHVEALHMMKINGMEYYWISCPKVHLMPTIGFTFKDTNGHYIKYTLHPKHYIKMYKTKTKGDYCVSEIAGISGDKWILGDTFLRYYVSYFNIDTKVVGLARAINYHKLQR